METTQLQNETIEKLLEAYLKASQQVEDLEASISVIREEMVLRLDEAHEKGKIVGEYAITKVTRTNFKPTLEQARELAAVKTVEQIDTQALKRLHDEGIEIPNTTITNFVMVKPLEKAN